jgi:mono/diheme cytochrome c family protein
MKAIKWVGIVLGGLAAVLAIAAAGFFAVGRSRLTRKYDPAPTLTEAAHDSAALARGEHIARIHGCRDCHGKDLGGQVFLDIPPGRFVAPNLTSGRGGVGGRYRDEDWDRAIRQGLRADSSSLINIMPYQLFNHFSDADAGALIAWLKSLPPVDHELPASSVRLPGYVMVSLADMNDFRGRLSRAPAESPPPGTAGYGAYLASTICVECHGKDLRGGKHPAPDAPPGPSLFVAATWSHAEFTTAVRTGVAPGGRKLSPWMPSHRLQYLTDEEIEALWAYLQSLRGAG